MCTIHSYIPKEILKYISYIKILLKRYVVSWKTWLHSGIRKYDWYLRGKKYITYVFEISQKMYFSKQSIYKCSWINPFKKRLIFIIFLIWSVCLVPARVTRVKYTIIGVTDACEPQVGMGELNLCPLQITTDLFLQWCSWLHFHFLFLKD